MRVVAMVLLLALKVGESPEGVSFAVDGRAGVIVTVTVGRLSGLRFVLDTGSSRSAVSDAVAEQLGLVPVARTEVVSAAGSSMAAVTSLPTVCLAGRCAKDLLVVLMPIAALKTKTGIVDGILGYDVLAQGDFTIDYKRRRFEWSGGLTTPHREDRLSLFVEEGRSVVEVPQTSRVALRLVADSGTDACVLFDGNKTRALPAWRGASSIGLATVVSDTRADSLVIRMLRVGGATWMNEVAAVIVRPSNYPAATDGLLPLDRFASVSFRHAERTLIVRHR